MSETFKVPAGWKLVPVEPTLEMVLAGERAMDEQLVKLLTCKERPDYPGETAECELVSRVQYRAMLSISPPPPL